jgi:RimJ/RimL family protein N-acetyltransferase
MARVEAWVKVEAWVEPDNTRSAGRPDQLRFMFEGRLRSLLAFGARRFDALVCSRTAER